MKKSVQDVDVAGKRVLVRVDFNVSYQNGQVLDDSRIRASLPTIRYLIEHHARIILLSHLAQPNGYVVESLRMDPVAARLAELLQQPVEKVNNCVGPEVQAAVQALQPGQVLMLENVRFHPGETANDNHFAAQLASIADLYVNDAFASVHRIQASTVAITHYLPAVAGLLMESELKGLLKIRSQIRHPVIILLGGSRLVDKSRFIDDSLKNHNPVLLGGVPANTFLRAKGLETGQSRVESQVIGLSREFLANAREKLQLPTDVVVADDLTEEARRKVVSSHHVPSTSYIVDVGPATVEKFSQTISEAGTVIWTGPMGIAEIPAFAKGTEALARKIASFENVLTIVAGGDTINVLNRLGLASKIDYLSTGGVALLNALEKAPLPAVKALQDADENPVEQSPENKNSRM